MISANETGKEGKGGRRSCGERERETAPSSAERGNVWDKIKKQEFAEFYVYIYRTCTYAAIITSIP